VANKTKKKGGARNNPKPGRILEMLTARIEGSVGDLDVIVKSLFHGTKERR